MSETRKLLGENADLPSPPAIAVRIIEEIKKDDSSMESLSQIISMDPALVLKILRVSNSSFYRTVSKVDTLQRALSVIGLEALKNIALSFVIVTDTRSAQKGGFDFDAFWRRSVTAAVGAEMIGEAIGFKKEDMFITALLQDIGVLILFRCRGDDYARVLDEKRVDNRPVVAVERDVFGFDHQRLGAEVLKEWGLPESIFGPVGFHHETDGVPEDLAMSSEILRIGDRLAAVYHGTQCNESLQDIKTALCGRFGLEDEQVDALIDGAAKKSIELLSFFELDAGDMKPFSQILQEANAELGKLNLSYEQLVIEMKQAKQKAEALARQLKAANLKLRELAIQDGLTGLLNRRHFKLLMDTEVKKAIRYDRPLSVVMFDLDHFKKVNDTYGHPTGDEVLRSVSAKVAGIVRTTDITARYGGEEFIVLLPETGLDGAVVLAKRIRMAIERLSFRSGSTTFQVTASLGVAAKDQGVGHTEAEVLIEAADKALYHSKKTGRNRVSAASIPTRAAA